MMKDGMNDGFAAALGAFHLPRYHEIPDVGLYLEQVTGYLSAQLGPLQSVSITSSMISNYVKKDLIPNPVKKRYNRRQVAALVCIVVAKTVLALEDIQVLLDMQRRLSDSQTAYDLFCDELEAVLGDVFGFGPPPAPLPADAPDTRVLIRKTVVAVAHKLYLDSYLRALAERG